MLLEAKCFPFCRAELNVILPLEQNGSIRSHPHSCHSWIFLVENSRLWALEQFETSTRNLLKQKLKAVVLRQDLG